MTFPCSGVWKSIPTEDSEGFMNYHYGFKDLKAGAAVRIAVSYKREVSSPSIIKTKRAAPGPVTEPDKGKTIDELIEEVFSEGTAPTDTTGTGMSGRTLMGIILLAVAVAIVISVIFKTVGKRSGEHAKAPLGSAQPDGKWQYCPQCGAGLARDHKFCPDCGNRIGR